MGDLSRLSDSELMAIVHGDSPSRDSDISKLSDAELIKIAEGEPSVSGAMWQGAKERGRQLVRGAEQLAAHIGIGLPEGTAHRFDTEVVNPEQKAADISNAPYAQAHPWAYGAGGMATDIAATIPLAMAAPEVAGAAWLPRIATLTGLGAAQGGLLNLTSPVANNSDYWTQKGAQTLSGMMTGGITAPLGDLALRGLFGLGKVIVSPIVNRLRTPAEMRPIPTAQMEGYEQQFGVPNVLSAGEITGNPYLMKTEKNLESAPGSGMPDFRMRQQKELNDLALRQRDISAQGLNEQPANIVANYLQKAVEQKNNSMQEYAQNAVNSQQPAGVPSPNAGVQQGLRDELAQRRVGVRGAYSAVDQALKDEGLAGAAIDTPNTMLAARELLRTINPDTWKSLSGSGLASKVQAIASGLNRTQTLERMPMENLAQVADNAYQRASAIFPDQANSVPFGKNRGELISTIQQLNDLISARPADILGPRPAGAQGILSAVRRLGGLKQDYMADAVGESKVQPGMMPGLFTKSGRSPDELALALQEEGYPVDPSPDGIEKMYSAIDKEMSGVGKTVTFEKTGALESQQAYDDALQRARDGAANLPSEWQPGQALSFKGVQALTKDLNDFYGKAKRASGGIGSQEEAAFSAVKAALARDTESWAQSTGSPRVLDAFHNANQQYASQIAPYKRTNTPEVTKVVQNEESDRAIGTLFNPNSPDLARKSFGLMTPAGQQSAKWGVWQGAMNAAMKSGTFDKSAFEGYFRQQAPVVNKIFNSRDMAEVQRVNNYLSSISVDPAVESAVSRALQTGDTEALLSQFAKANKPTSAQRITSRLATPESRQAVESWVVDNAYNKAFDERSQIFSPKRFAGELAKFSSVLNQVSPPERIIELTGLARLMDRAAAAGQFMENPPTGQRVLMALQGYGPMAAIGGIVGGSQTPGDWATKTGGAVAGALAGAGVRTGSANLVRSFLTQPWGRAVLRKLGSMEENTVDRALQSPGIKNLLYKTLESAGVASANSAYQEQQPSQ